MRTRARTLLLSLLLSAGCTAMAGTVEVTFVNPASFADAGITQDDKDANLKMLDRYLQGLGQRLLPADQVLRIEVLDLSLAGTIRHRGRGDIRVLRGGADYPRVHLRYVLQGGGAPRSGDEWVSDLTYADGLASAYRSEPLYYEKRMLANWFKDRFVAGHAPAG